MLVPYLACPPRYHPAARRDALLASKVFTCMCTKCTANEDPKRHVPCPLCHPRGNGEERELEPSVALATVRVSYAEPSSAVEDGGAHWRCARCPTRRFTDAEVLPGPKSGGGLMGRAWERLLERHILQVCTSHISHVHLPCIYRVSC